MRDKKSITITSVIYLASTSDIRQCVCKFYQERVCIYVMQSPKQIKLPVLEDLMRACEHRIEMPCPILTLKSPSFVYTTVFLVNGSSQHGARIWTKLGILIS